jgi:uncharacterized protein with ATP-grasp and redox domains
MSIGANTTCLECYLKKTVETARSLGDEQTATRFCKELMGRLADLPAHHTTPHLAPAVAEMFTRYYGLEDRFAEEKKAANAFVLERLPRIQSMAETAPDPVGAGLRLAILGNYLDFSALHKQVSFEYLDELIQNALHMELDEAVVDRFRSELSAAKELLYLTDNAGEIGFDRVCAQQLQKAYPHLTVTFCVRGGNALNDATREDAQAVGLEFPLIDNGNTIPGTDPDSLGEEARAAFRRADVILAKGMANVETLYGCGANIYYAFLVKCQRFVELFDRPHMTPMFVAEMAKGE